MTKRKMTANEVRDALLRIMDQNPDKTNPMIYGGCVYTSADGASHCVVGQLAVDKGWPLPAADAMAASRVGEELNWPVSGPALDVMDRAQIIADNAAARGVTWGAAAVEWRAYAERYGRWV